MTDKKDDIEVTVSEDTDLALPLDVDILKDEKDAPVTAATEEKSIAEDDPVESLRRQLAEAKEEAERERRARSEIEKRAQDSEILATSATHHVLAAQLDSIESHIANTKQKIDNAKRAYSSALEVADYDAAAKAQEELSMAAYDLRTLDNGKRELQHRQKQAKEAPPPQAKSSEPSADEFVNHLINNGTKATSEYALRNRDNLRTDKQVKKVQAVHQLAVAEGIQVDTPEYFSFIDKQMGWNQQQVEQRPAPKPQAKTVAAPVSRDGAPGTTNPNRVTLTPAQVAIAKELGISPTAYAKNLMKLKANGRDPTADGLRLSADMQH